MAGSTAVSHVSRLFDVTKSLQCSLMDNSFLHIPKSKRYVRNMMFSVVKRRRSDSRRYFYALTQAKLRRVSIGIRQFNTPFAE